MTEDEDKALIRIAATTDPEGLRRTATNAHGKSEIVEKAALRRLAAVSPKHAPGTVEHDCWGMIHAVGGAAAAQRKKGKPHEPYAPED